MMQAPRLSLRRHKQQAYRCYVWQQTMAQARCSRWLLGAAVDYDAGTQDAAQRYKLQALCCYVWQQTVAQARCSC